MGKKRAGSPPTAPSRIVYSPLGDLKRVDVERDFVHSATPPRIENLLDAFSRAERAAESARDHFGTGLTFMGIPIGAVLHGASIKTVLPPVERASDIIDRS